MNDEEAVKRDIERLVDSMSEDELDEMIIEPIYIMAYWQCAKDVADGVLKTAGIRHSIEFRAFAIERAREFIDTFKELKRQRDSDT